MNKRKFLIIGGITIIVLWLLSWGLLICFIPKSDDRGQFGDMFGAVNSLFSGLALCGVVYTILLQTESNKSSEYQFRFNHLLDIINKQTEIFNERILEFSFKNIKGNSIDFSRGISFFKEISSDEDKTEIFIKQNSDTIHSLLPFIYHSNKFTHDLIDEENISKTDKERLKKLFFRNQNRFVLDYHSLNHQMLETEKDEYESLQDDLKQIAKDFFKIRVSMTMAILKGEYS